MIITKRFVVYSFITIALLCINVLIFLFRNHGFEYKQYFSASSIGTDCDESCIKKWNQPASNFSTVDLTEAHTLLQQNINIDSISSPENKLTAIGAWLNNELSYETGNKSDSVNALPALKQYYCFKNNRQFSYDCGNFQPIVSLFCTSVNLPCRNFQNIQIPAVGLANDSHVAIEVYLKEYKKWVLTDPYQNHLLVKKNNIPLSASEYLDYNIAGGNDTVCIIKQAAGRAIIDTVTPARFKEDAYFNKNYTLYFYKETGEKSVYSFPNKLKRYFWPSSWYEVYAPQQKNTNLLFRIKQVSAILLTGWLSFLLFRTVRKHKND
jgi:hypothetical protein